MADPALIFDRALQRRFKARALALGPATFLLDRVVEELAERLDAVTRRFEVALDLGTPGALAAERLAGRDSIGDVIASFADAAAAPRVLGAGVLTVAADEELLPFRPQSLDLVVSALALQTVNDLPGTLAQIRHALKPDGLLLAAMLGGDTLCELRAAFAAAEAETLGGSSPRIAPFADVRSAGALLQRAGFALPVTDRDRIVVRYETPFPLLADLRRMGAANALVERRRIPLRRATLQRMAKIYAERFSDPDGRIRATFDVLWLSGWVPHPSQQKPLKPGSAVVRLADALGAREYGAGD